MTPARVAWIFFGLALGGVGNAVAADFAPEIFGSVGIAHPFRIEDRDFGMKPSVGGGVGVRIGSRLGVEGEFHQVLGLELEPVVCGVVIPPCVGSAREGLRSLRIAGVNVLYFFGRSRAQFYLTGGAGALFSREMNSIVEAGPTEARISEFEESETGFAWNVGAGARIPIAASLALRPEIRIYDATAGSRGNLGLLRASVSLAYYW